MPGGSTSTLLTLLLAFVRSFADDQPADEMEHGQR